MLLIVVIIHDHNCKAFINKQNNSIISESSIIRFWIMMKPSAGARKIVL